MLVPQQCHRASRMISPHIQLAKLFFIVCVLILYIVMKIFLLMYIVLRSSIAACAYKLHAKQRNHARTILQYGSLVM